jgi:hypothetical protein
MMEVDVQREKDRGYQHRQTQQEPQHVVID